MNAEGFWEGCWQREDPEALNRYLGGLSETPL